MPSHRFWQRFLAAEMPPARGRAFLEGLDPSDFEPIQALEAFLDSAPNERRRMDAASMDAVDRLFESGVQVLTAGEVPALAPLGFPPAAIFTHGDLACFDAPTVAIVGTRNASTYGKAVAEKFGEALARAGVTVVSGGALGIDAAAHRGALKAGGRTIAVLAGGIDTVYPAIHGGLFTQIRERGCLVSQFAIGTPPIDYRFLMRNGLIAALGLATLVIEAPAKSGALRTAHDAADFGREVFVVPANIDNLKFFGSFGLIRDGATLVTHPDEILDAMGVSRSIPASRTPKPSSLGDQILSVLSVQPMPVELIVENTRLATAEVLSELTILELEGRVIRDAGGYATRP